MRVKTKNYINHERICNKKYNCSGPRHLKVKELNISLTRNYCITISIQLISSIHIFILKIQKILESLKLKDYFPVIFDHAHLKIVESLNQKSNRLATSIFDYAHPIGQTEG